ncbi:MAG: right-handed parallel beta-helix repeat-containing protein [Myxococcales bacterium]
MLTRSSPPLFAGMSFVAAFLAAGVAHAADYYVAPTGSDSNAGTMAAPFASLQKGHDAASAGDTVWLRAGTYKSTKQIKLSKSGTSDTQRIKFFAYTGEKVTIDFSGYVSTNKAADTPALLVTGNWLHLKGFEIVGAPVGASGDHSISALRSEGASNNTFELLNIHHNFGPGLFISKGTGGNLILNVDSHDNYDKDGSQGDGQNGDGFGVHYQETGPSTIIRGCRAWLDSDDGYDLISQEVPVIVENSWAIQNGYANGGSTSPSSGNGNGFKMGSSQTGIRHIVRFNVAWKNKAAGFYANHSSGGNTWLNNTSYMNGTQYNMLASPAGDSASTITLSGALAHKMRNNVGFPNKNTNMGGVDTMFNTWDLNIAEAASDFVSTSDTGTLGARQADGSLPAVDFLKLKAGSPLIDKGTDVMLPFVGTAPDLGADEFGAVKPPSGGSGGSGGGPSAGGSATTGGVSNGGMGTTTAGAAGMTTAPGGGSAGNGNGGSGPVTTGGAVTGTPGGNMPYVSDGAANNPVDPSGGSAGGGGSDDGSGCSCSWKNRRGTGGTVTALLLLGAVLRRRRARRL